SYSGFINSNHAKEIDCSTEFMNGLEELSRGVGAVRFHAPFREKTKADVVRQALNLAVPIGRTFSCQASSSFPCGACPNCVERLNALVEAGLA
ncbi:7-cyano-7-deazaguanine synthase, partial [Rhodovulum sulfidophilum]|nr:7-cyano-7-deazaguanine synthase [Rhodovulum sulfidophilum]